MGDVFHEWSDLLPAAQHETESLLQHFGWERLQMTGFCTSSMFRIRSHIQLDRLNAQTLIKISESQMIHVILFNVASMGCQLKKDLPGSLEGMCMLYGIGGGTKGKIILPRKVCHAFFTQHLCLRGPPISFPSELIL